MSSYFKKVISQCEEKKRIISSFKEESPKLKNLISAEFPWLYNPNLKLEEYNIYNKTLLKYIDHQSQRPKIKITKVHPTEPSIKIKVTHLALENKNEMPKEKKIPYIKSENSMKEPKNQDIKVYEGIVKYFPKTNKFKIQSLIGDNSIFTVTGQKFLNRAFVGDTVRFVNVANPFLKKKEKSTKAARVISISERSTNSHYFVGKIVKNFNNYSHLLISQDLKYPNTFISKKDPGLDNLSDDVICISKFTTWAPSEQFPTSTIVMSYADLEHNEIDIETRYLMTKNNLVDFLVHDDNRVRSNANTELELVSTVPRKDLTGDCIFTIDPATACDLDDAISFKKIDNNCFQIGTHIADVSFYVTPGSEVDERAKKLCTSVYVTHRAYHMLPASLSGDICSLNPGKNRYTVSILFTIDSSFNIIDKWIGRSVIRSCAKMSYEQAQTLLDAEICPDDMDINIHSSFSLDDIHSNLHHISKFTRFLRNQRFGEGGSLKLDTPEISFLLDDITKIPQTLYAYKLQESNNLIEELMLLSNKTIAQIIMDKFPNNSVLRVHPPPENSIKSVVKILSSYGYKVDPSSSSSITKSLGQLSEMHGSEIKNTVAFFLSKPFLPASYVYSGSVSKTNKSDIYSLYHHYGLNFDLYAHFTSPIRRYPDILVHRLLLSCTEETVDIMDSKSQDMDMLIELCNQRNKAATMVEKDSNLYNLWLFIRTHGSLTCKGIIIPGVDVLFSNKKAPPRVLLLPYCLPLFLPESALKDSNVSYFKIIDLIVSADSALQPHRSTISPFKIEILPS